MFKSVEAFNTAVLKELRYWADRGYIGREIQISAELARHLFGPKKRHMVELFFQPYGGPIPIRRKRYGLLIVKTELWRNHELRPPSSAQPVQPPRRRDPH